MLIFINMKTLIQKLLRESINEISYNQNPSQGNFDIDIENDGSAIILADDGQGNDIDMYLKKLSFDNIGNKCDSCYEYSFSFNQSMTQGMKSTPRHYFQVLSIAMQALIQVMNQVKPNLVIIKPTEKEGKSNQKLNIYDNLFKSRAIDFQQMGYSIKPENDSIRLEKTN